MTNSEQKRAILAVVLSGLVLFAWQAYFAPKQPVNPPASTVVESKDQSNSVTTKTVAVNEPAKTEVQANSNAGTQNVAAINESVVPWMFKGDGYNYTLNSNLQMTKVINNKSVFPYEDIVGTANSLKVHILTTTGSEELIFVEDVNTPKTGTYLKAFNEKYGIDLELRLNEKGLLAYTLNSKNAYRYRLAMPAKPGEMESTAQVRDFIYFSEDVDRITAGDSESGEGKFKWFGVDFNYHFTGFVFKERQNVSFKTTENEPHFYVDTVNPTNQLAGEFLFVKKEYDYLKDLGNNLDLTVDFGILGIIAVPMLHSLQWIYKYVPNYGLALIVLTIFIRMLLFPLSFSSFKSMKKMQKIQPELQKLKEKHKDDPQRMQKETMELFKRAGANPLGGCLPMLLQMPIFFAFYKVLYGAVELVGAPFYGWIHDLSIKDPYYVLPVFMALSMFAQQKLTPTTTTDPTQQKVMMFMPLIFGFIMKDLPAGLNLYIAVSTLFGIGQQLLVYRLTD